LLVFNSETVQARGGWKREERRIKQELAVWEKLARKAGRLPNNASADSAVATSAPAKASGTAKKDAQAKKPRAASAPALTYRLPPGVTKKEQKVADDVAKVMSKLLDRVEKRVEVAVCSRCLNLNVECCSAAEAGPHPLQEAARSVSSYAELPPEAERRSRGSQATSQR
jgi:hypothetical protein